jgi:hypothetical protein
MHAPDDVKKLWSRFFEAERSFAAMASGKEEYFDTSMEQETLFVIKQWMHACSRLASELHLYNSTAAYKQSALLIHKLHRLAPPNQIGLFHTNVHNFMILGMFQEAYDWMINIFPECCKREIPEFCFVPWKKETDFSTPIEKDEIVPLFSSRTYAVEETYGALFFIKFHYYQQCLMKEAFEQSFLLGTHDRLGKASSIYRLGGNELVLREIFSFLVPGSFKKKEVRKSGEVFQQLQELLRIPEAKPLWKCLFTSSRVVAEFIHQPIMLYRQLSLSILRWKNFSEGIKFMKDFFHEEDEFLSSKEK